MTSRAVKPSYRPMASCMVMRSFVKWRRYWSGVVPTRRAKARWRVSGPPKPVAAATVATGEDGRLEQAAGRLDPQGLDVRGGRGAGLGPEAAGEAARAHRGPTGEHGDGEVLVEVVGQPALQLGDRVGAGGPGGELRAELGLAAGAAHEDDQPAGDGVGELGAVVVLDEGEGEVDAGGDAGRGPAVAVADVDAVGVDLHLGVARRRAARRPTSAWSPGGRRAARPRPARTRRCTPT